MTSDEQMLFFNTDSTPPHISQATRADVNAPFSNAHELTELSSASGESATWISSDHCRLYFTRNTAPFVASRTP